MNFWEELLDTINESKVGFVVAMLIGFGLYRLSQKSIKNISENINVVINEDNGRGDHKMVFVIRNDLKMGKGKVAAQCAHAAVANYKLAQKYPKILAAWEDCGQKKITLRVDSEKELIEIKQKAISLGLIAYIIQDAGHTQIAAGSKTVCGVGPGFSERIDQVTGHLKLY